MLATTFPYIYFTKLLPVTTDTIILSAVVGRTENATTGNVSNGGWKTQVRKCETRLLCVSICMSYQTSCRRPAATICLSPLQVDNIFVFIRQVAPIPACWLFNTAATSWPLTFWSWNWCSSHVWRGLPRCQF